MPLAPSYLSGGLAARVPGALNEGFSGYQARMGYKLLTNPVAASTTAFASTGVAGPNASTITIGRAAKGLTGFDGTLGASGGPDFPRNVVITVTHATSVVAVSGVISGKDQYGRDITETWSVTATGTSKTYTGAKAFKRVDSVTITAVSDASTDTVKVGTGQVFGLDFRNAAVGLVKEQVNGAVVTTGTVVAAGTGAAVDAQGTYSPATAPDGAHTYEAWYLVNDLEV